MKCRYLDEITGSRGVVFATGTPISNSMAELFTMQRYLQRETLEQHGLSSFDAWASTFGETVTAWSLRRKVQAIGQKRDFPSSIICRN